MTLQKYLQERVSKAQIRRRHVLYGLALVVILFISALYLVNLSPYKPAKAGNSQQAATQTIFVRATVVKVNDTNATTGDQTVQVNILDGQDKGTFVTVDRSYVLGDANAKRLPIGSTVLLTIHPANGNQYSYFDRFRLQGAMSLLLVLLLLVIAIGRWRGFTSAVGLTISIGILAVFVVPRLIAGQAAFATCIEGSFMIAAVSIFIAHGFTKRTALAFASTLGTLVLIIGIAAVAVYVTGVSGNPGATVNAEQSIPLLQYAPHHIDLTGLFLGGLVIASLGVLEDITTGQAAAVDEIYKANPKLSVRQLYSKGLSVGHEHIAALINTLAIVYVGFALPTIVLTVLYTGHGPLAATLNDEILMETVVRTIVPSIGLLLAVPLSTGLAAYVLPRWYT